MCFIKIGDPLAPCDHEECRKTLEAYKVSNCLHQFPLQALKMHPLQNVKRPRPSAPKDYPEVAQDVLKRMKFDKDEAPKSSESNENLKNLLNGQSNVGFQGFQPNYSYLMANNSPANQYGLIQQNYNKCQVSQPQMHNYNVYNGNNGFNDAMLNLQLRMNMNCSNGGMSLQPTHSQVNHNQEKEQQYEKSLYSALISQNNMLFEMSEKTNALAQTMGKLIHDLEDLQKTVSIIATEKKIDEVVKKEKDSTVLETTSDTSSLMPLPTTSEISHSEELINYLYINKNQKFKYQLCQSKTLDLPIYRERNFSFSVCIKDMNNKEVFHTNRIPLSIALYSYENPPKCIDTNTSGHKILKGLMEKDLVNGQCGFEKIQVKEVTSHYRKGKVFLVVYPKMPTFGLFPQESLINSFIDYTAIKPLVIENVVVKAKKLPKFLKKGKRSSKVETSEEAKDTFSSICLSDKASIFEDSS